MLGFSFAESNTTDRRICDLYGLGGVLHGRVLVLHPGADSEGPQVCPAVHDGEYFFHYEFFLPEWVRGHVPADVFPGAAGAVHLVQRLPRWDALLCDDRAEYGADGAVCGGADYFAALDDFGRDSGRNDRDEVLRADVPVVGV